MENQYHAPVQYGRHNRSRKKHRKIRVNAAVLVVVSFVIICIVGSVMLGTYLKERAADFRRDDPDTIFTKPPESTRATAGVSEIEVTGDVLRSGCLNIAGAESLDEISERADKLFLSGYDSVTVPLTDSTGRLLYRSPAAIALSRMSDKIDSLPLDEIILRIRDAGKAHGINPKITAYYTMSTPDDKNSVLAEAALLYDTAIIAEAHDMGADEILLSGIAPADSSTAACDEIIDFLEKFKDDDGSIPVGLAFLPEVYKDTKMSTSLERISSVAGFLAVDTSEVDFSVKVTTETVYYTDENGETAEEYEDVTVCTVYGQLCDIISSIKGSVSLYSLRFIINGEDMFAVSEAVDALTVSGAYSYYVISMDDITVIPTPDDTDISDDLTSATDKTESTKKPKDTKKSESSKQTEKDTEAPPETTLPEPDTESETESDTETEFNLDDFWEWLT